MLCSVLTHTHTHAHTVPWSLPSPLVAKNIRHNYSQVQRLRQYCPPNMSTFTMKGVHTCHAPTRLWPSAARYICLVNEKTKLCFPSHLTAFRTKTKPREQESAEPQDSHVWLPVGPKQSHVYESQLRFKTCVCDHVLLAPWNPNKTTWRRISWVWRKSSVFTSLEEVFLAVHENNNQDVLPQLTLTSNQNKATWTRPATRLW